MSILPLSYTSHSIPITSLVLHTSFIPFPAASSFCVIHFIITSYSTYSHPFHISWTYISLSINSVCQSSLSWHSFLQYSLPSSYMGKFPCYVCFLSSSLVLTPFTLHSYITTSCYPCSFTLSSSPPLPLPTPSYSYTHFPATSICVLSFHLNHHLYLSFI